MNKGSDFFSQIGRYMCGEKLVSYQLYSLDKAVLLRFGLLPVAK